MKVYKNALFLLFISALTITLVACGNNKNEDSKNKKQNNTVHIAEILNGKQERQIIMAEETDNTETPQVRWAGFIGNGKVDAHPYYQNDDLEFSELAFLTNKEFKIVLDDEDNNYVTADDNGKELKIEYGKRKTTLDYKLDNTNNEKGFMFDLNDNKLGNDNDKASITGPLYGTPKTKDHGWLVIETNEQEDINGDVINPQRLYIKANKGEGKIDISDVEKYAKKYDNVKITE